MQTRLSLRYSGPSVDSGAMDVYEAAANMMAFSDFMVAAAKATYGDAVQARAEVAGFGRGSFITDIAIHLGGPLATLFTAGSVSELLTVVTESINLWKHLKGEPPAEVVPGQNNTVRVTNNNGQVLAVNAQAVQLVFSDKAAEAAGRFIRQALAADGMDDVFIDAREESNAVTPIARVTRAESGFFVPVAPQESLLDQTYKVALVIEAPVFKDGNKWRFNDGTGSFYAEVADGEFIERVNQGEPFAKGDALIVDMRLIQRRQGDRIIAEKVVIKVHEHKRRNEQIKLF